MIKVKIKERKFFLNHPKFKRSDYPPGSISFGSSFVAEMFKYCGKRIALKKIECKFPYAHDVYKGEGYYWDDWMFEIIPEFDENKNYLLEF